MAQDEAATNGAAHAGSWRWQAPRGFWLALVLGGMGCVVIFGSSLSLEQPGYYAIRQGTWLLLGLVLYVLCSRLRPATWERSLPWLTALSLAALAGVLLVGAPHHGMRGWYVLNLPFGGEYFKVLQLQPSELAKPVFVLFVAWLLCRHPQETSPDWKEYLWIASGVGMWLLLIGLQPDFGTALIYALTFAVMYWLRGGRAWHLAVTALAGLPVAWLIYLRFSYVRNRFTGFLDPEGHASGAGYHYLQNQAALASGGWLGRSHLDPTVTGSYLPHAHSDSVFASLGEQVGLLGTLGLLLCLALWLAWLAGQAPRQQALRRTLTLAGIGTVLGVQALIHISVTLGVLPPTGVTLPLLSYGGSSLLGAMAALGIAVSLQREALSGPPPPPGTRGETIAPATDAV